MQEGMPPQAEGPASEGGGSIGDLITATDKNLAILAKAAGSGGLPPEIAQGFAQVSEQFRSLVEAALQADGGGAPQKPGARPAGGTSSPEQAGNPNARPVGV